MNNNILNFDFNGRTRNIELNSNNSYADLSASLARIPAGAAKWYKV